MVRALMRHGWRALLIGIGLASSGAHAQTVSLAEGSLRGATQDGVTSFKGIPFAAPPIGPDRWRPPQPVRPWNGDRDATRFGPDCMQSAGFGGASGRSRLPMSEDCLFLNVWRPADVGKGEKLPVMLWIYGGAFLFGSGADQTYSGEQFARQRVILVTVNYRLGRFGFFAFPALSKEHPEEPKGNYAYMDQIAALGWVKRNIEAFGGDPSNVTIFGESAGGVSVHSLLTIPAARGLFHRAIIESGGGRDGTLTGRPMRADNEDRNYPLSAETIGLNFARRHGIMTRDAQALARLRSLSAEDILDGGRQTDGEGGAQTYSGPVVDGTLVVETAEQAYKAGRQARVPLLIGSNSAEVRGGFLAARTKDELFAQFAEGREAAISAYDPAGTQSLENLMTLAITDRVWAEPARFTARAFAALDLPAFVYRFSYVPSAMKGRIDGAPHASELPFVFDTLASRPGSISSQDRNVAQMMNGYWANFARTGNPNGRGMPAWPRYEPASDPILDFAPDGMPRGGPDPNRARLDATEKAGGAVIPR